MDNSGKFTVINEGFTCANCGSEVKPSSKSCRNHCPHCLYSIHLDVFPGDRGAGCGGVMKPIEVTQHSKKGYQVVHRCQACGTMTRNVLRLDDDIQPDSLERVLELMRNKI